MLYVNGVDATNGEYLIPPLTEHDLALAVQGNPLDRASTAELQARHRRVTESHLAPRHGIDPSDLAESGWGVVTATDADPAVLAALRPLLERRRTQASRLSEGRYRELTGVDGYRRGESKSEFQARHGAGPGPVDPDVMPYHLLIVGSPAEVPFDVQYQLDVQHAVGRLHFAEVEQYAAYARTVVAGESEPRNAGPTELCVFATRNDGDAATELSEANLAKPLAQTMADDAEHWRVRRLLGPDATKAALWTQVNGGAPPEILLTASHGVAFPSGHAMQGLAQGALLCQDWPGPGHGPVTPDHWFGASDIERCGADLSGTIAFFFACFGAGTPREDDFGHGQSGPRPLAPSPFVAALPQAILGREGGALAVVGHVDRAWGYSFLWPGAGAQTEVFRSCLGALGAGQSVGAALEYLGDRHAEIATELAQTLDMLHLGKRADESALVGLWTAYADARNVIVLGDPAARLRQPAGPATASQRDVIAVHHDRARSTTPVAAGPEQAARDIEVATYVTEDPSNVTVDASSGRITGARLQLRSFVRPDGNAQHVITLPVGNPSHDQNGDLVAEIHARLLEVSLAAQRTKTVEGDPSD